jgi:hypothetical protein
MTGKICRVRSGPPVAESSSAASYSASTVIATASSSDSPACHSFYNELFANTDPEPTEW